MRNQAYGKPHFLVMCSANRVPATSRQGQLGLPSYLRKSILHRIDCSRKCSRATAFGAMVSSWKLLERFSRRVGISERSTTHGRKFELALGAETRCRLRSFGHYGTALLCGIDAFVVSTLAHSGTYERAWLVPKNLEPHNADRVMVIFGSQGQGQYLHAVVHRITQRWALRSHGFYFSRRNLGCSPWGAFSCSKPVPRYEGTWNNSTSGKEGIWICK